jgi:hypothetical protein
VKVSDVDSAKFVSPLYTAVMEWEATDKADVLNVATPPDNAPVPRSVVLSLKVTVPVALDVTVAVKVTRSPENDGLSDDVIPVVVDALLTIKLPEVALAPKFPCAAYAAFKV